MCIFHKWNTWEKVRSEYLELPQGLLVFYFLQCRSCKKCGKFQIDAQEAMPRKQIKFPPTEEETPPLLCSIVPSDVHELMIDIWGNKLKRGYGWIGAKFPNIKLDTLPESELKDIYDCLWSKKNLKECRIHKRIHDTKVRGQ